jgi:hypothetical protein
MRLSDAGLRQRQTKLLYSNHRSPPWLKEDRTPAIARTVEMDSSWMAVRHRCAKLSMLSVSAKALTRRSPI